MSLHAFSDPLIALKDFPVETWDPPYCGELPIRIGRDGRWYYLDSPIGRERLVQLFARILKREGDKYFLVSPVEKVGIHVDDAPFVAVHFEVEGQGDTQVLNFQTNVGDMVRLDAEHPLRVDIHPLTGQPSPYLRVRDGLWALLARPVYYQLVELAEEVREPGGTRWLVHSAGSVHCLGTDAEAQS